MLQRIQTVYWLLAVLLVLLWIFFPYAVIESPAGSFSLFASGLRSDLDRQFLFFGWGTVCLGAFSVALLLITVFSYRRVHVQLRLSVFSALLLVGLVLLEVYYVYFSRVETEGIWRVNFTFWFPLLAACFSMLGFRGVRRDQAFIRRMERLR